MGTGVTVDAIGVDAFLMCNPGSLEVELKLNVIASFSGAFGVGILTVRMIVSFSENGF
jgi:hypothetical protein